MNELEDSLPYCTVCLNYMQHARATVCEHCHAHGNTPVTMLTTLKSKGRGSLMLAALGVSLVVGGCDGKEPAPTPTPVALEPEASSITKSVEPAASKTPTPPEEALVQPNETKQETAKPSELIKTLTKKERRQLEQAAQLKEMRKQQEKLRRSRKRKVPMYGSPP